MPANPHHWAVPLEDRDLVRATQERYFMRQAVEPARARRSEVHPRTLLRRIIAGGS